MHDDEISIPPAPLLLDKCRQPNALHPQECLLERMTNHGKNCPLTVPGDSTTPPSEYHRRSPYNN